MNVYVYIILFVFVIGFVIYQFRNVTIGNLFITIILFGVPLLIMYLLFNKRYRRYKCIYGDSCERKNCSNCMDYSTEKSIQAIKDNKAEIKDEAAEIFKRYKTELGDECEGLLSYSYFNQENRDKVFDDVLHNSYPRFIISMWILDKYAKRKNIDDDAVCDLFDKLINMGYVKTTPSEDWFALTEKGEGFLDYKKAYSPTTNLAEEFRKIAKEKQSSVLDLIPGVESEEQENN